ncbi:RecA-like DNA recombinase [Microbacterium phage RikSengupta]|nr:RecA-like DNA recombinase [Microbacterium phage TinyMiny]UVF61378.1 RecA-like DNA recombinase [Microbacterium phage Sparcetus]WMI33145.1 RecA-like DNA recombinase [Microbacterium phage RikSengupta]
MAIPKNVKQLGSVDKFVNFLLVAGPGFGKTVLFGTDDNVLFLTTDPEGTVSAWMMGSKAREWECNSYSDVIEAYTYLRDGGIEELGLTWVVIDNISEVQELAKHSNITMERRRNPNIDEFVPSQANYQRQQNMLLALVKQFNDLPVNVGYTAWMQTMEDNEGQEYFAPGIHGQKGQIAQMVAGYMNVVGYGEVVEDEKGDEHRVIFFSQTGPYRGKDRFNALGKKRTDLTLPKMKSIIDRKVAERNSAARPKAATGTTTKARTTGTTPRRRTTTATRKKA